MRGGEAEHRDHAEQDQQHHGEGKATCSHTGALWRASQPRTGETAMTRVSARTTGPTIEPTAWTPASVITAAAAQTSTIRARGNPCRVTSRSYPFSL
ncbi:hypothetical protein GCM10027612_31020 [Microbispora bryophytorum subsp. camponoti]